MISFNNSRTIHVSCDRPELARDMRRYFSLVGVPSLAPAVAIAKAEAAERALRLLSSSRHDDTNMPLLKEKRENSAAETEGIQREQQFYWSVEFKLMTSCGQQE